ncbi:MAG: YXWGXW repeat-containing protein [Steroidobacteraceae bacterium]|nr:YXWGXW repeat-containing protein [Steroidobacteraceae bacterium]
MKKPIALLAVLISIGLAGCVVASPPRRVAVVEVDVRPPPPRVVVVPAPRRGYAWAAGFWRWDGHRHVWVDGQWMRARRGWTWAPAHWVERRGRWHFEPGVWIRVGR